jgi:hypothetical protein
LGKSVPRDKIWIVLRSSRVKIKFFSIGGRMPKRTNLISETPLLEMFVQGISDQSDKLAPPLSDEVIQYLANILIRFSRSKNLFVTNDESRSLPTLAFLYQDANQATTSYQRNISLRQLGDSALFIGSLFPEHYAQKGINRDYFIGMGGGAYCALGDANYGDADTFYEMAEKFPKLINILANACYRELDYNASEIFSLLERWQTSKDETLRKQLDAIGIVPAEFSRKH